MSIQVHSTHTHKWKQPTTAYVRVLIVSQLKEEKVSFNYEEAEEEERKGMCVLIFPEAESLLHLFFFFLYSLLILLAEFSLFSTSMTRKRKKKNRCSRSRSKAQHSTRLLLLRENPITGLVQLPTARSSLLPSPAFFSSSYRLMWTVPVQINQAGRQWNQRECTSLSGLLRFSLSLSGA